MHDSYLIQRLSSPVRPSLIGKTQPHHIFGGHATGLSPEAWAVLDSICTVEYMGSAEFEAWNGSSPLGDAFFRLVEWGKEDKLSSFAFVLPPEEVPTNWRRTRTDLIGSSISYPFVPKQSRHVFGLCFRDEKAQVIERTKEIIQGKVKHKQHTNVESVFDLTDPSNVPRTKGWLDVRNAFLFFSDEAMWFDFCQTFGAKTCDVPPLPPSPDYSKLYKSDLVSIAVSLGCFSSKAHANKTLKQNLVTLLSSHVQPISTSPPVSG